MRRLCLKPNRQCRKLRLMAAMRNAELAELIMSLVLVLIVVGIALTTGQYTHVYSDENELKCDATCGRQIDNLLTQLSRMQKELERVKEALNLSQQADVPNTEPGPLACPPNFTRITEVNGCYRAGLNLANWSVAADTCISFHSNAHLVAVDNEAEQRAVANWFKNHTDSGQCSSYGFWTAGQRTDPSRVTPFVWKLRTSNDYEELPLNYTNWRQGEPNNLGGTSTRVNEACLHVWKYSSYQWNDETCSYGMCFVCEWKM